MLLLIGSFESQGLYEVATWPVAVCCYHAPVVRVRSRRSGWVSSLLLCYCYCVDCVWCVACRFHVCMLL